MKKLLEILLMLNLFGGCISFPIVKMDAPGPKDYQVAGSTEQVKHTTTAVVDAQNTKVVAMKETGTTMTTKKVEAVQAIATALGEKTQDPEALSNINANAMSAIVQIGNEEDIVREIGKVDGTTKVVGGIAGRGIESTETPTVQYGMYAAGTTALGLAAIPEAQRQFVALKKWTFSEALPWVIGLVTAGTGGGLGAWFWRRFRRERKANIDTIEGIEDFKQQHPDEKKGINDALARRHSGSPVDMATRVEEVQWERERQKKSGRTNVPVAKA